MWLCNHRRFGSALRARNLCNGGGALGFWREAESKKGSGTFRLIRASSYSANATASNLRKRLAVGRESQVVSVLYHEF